MIIYPDAYTPAGAAAGAAGASAVSSGGTVTAANWRKMQLQGCVFLPDAGYKYSPTSSSTYTEFSLYWSSTERGNLYGVSPLFNFKTKTVQPGYNMKDKTTGIPVRLVHVL